MPRIEKLLFASATAWMMLACACGSPSGTSASASAERSSAMSASSAGSSAKAAPSSSAAGPSAPTSRVSDPKMQALIAPILDRCNLNEICLELNDFQSKEDDYLRSSEADEVLLDMLTGKDPRLAEIASVRRLYQKDLFFKDKSRLERVFAMLEMPTNSDRTLDGAAAWIAWADFEKLGFSDRLRALAKSPSVAVRKALAKNLILSGSTKSQPVALETVALLLQDTDKDVKRGAALSLQWAHLPQSCQILAKALEKGDETSDVVAERSAKNTDCDGLKEKVDAYLKKKPAKK